MSDAKFATAINCMDGRVQEPVINWFKQNYGVDYVDAVTEPGPIRHLAEHNRVLVDTIRDRVKISVRKHHSNVVAVVGHDDCAGNPVSKEDQIRHIEQAVETVRSWDFEVRVIGLYVNGNVDVELVRE